MPAYFLALIALCAAVLGGIGWLQFLAGEIPAWKIVGYGAAGALLPLVIALAWALLVVPPSLGKVIRGSRDALRRMFASERRP